MIGNIQIKLGGTALTASLGYEGVLARGLSRLWRRRARHAEDFNDETGAANANFSISETLEKVTVVFEVPGYSRDELLLEATPHSVRLSGPKLSTEGRTGGSLDRLVPLVEAVEPERITASLQDGLLTVDLPKAAWVQGKARRVPINAGPSVATAQHKEHPDNHA